MYIIYIIIIIISIIITINITILWDFEVTAMVQDGMFHADPHAGNVRLVLDPTAPGGAKPVLLDWGLIREITDAERLGLAKVD